MAKYNVIFLGTTDLSVTILKGLSNNPQVNLQLVITQPDRKVGRKQELAISPVKHWAKQAQIKLEQPESIKTLIPLIKKMSPDFLITAAYGQIVPQEILDSAKIEALNVHGSLLPSYRGGAPVQMSIWNGDLESGVTVMRMVKKMDAGPIFGQAKLKLDRTINSGELMDQVANLGSDLLNQLLIPIATKKIKPINQDLEKVSFAYNIKPEQEQIDWNKNVSHIHNQIRALAPKPGAFTTHNNQRLKIYKTLEHLDANSKYSPGTIVAINKGSIHVQTGKGILELLEVQKAGKNKINAGIFGKNSLKIGDRFN